jgi:hypothetical protein
MNQETAFNTVEYSNGDSGSKQPRVDIRRGEKTSGRQDDVQRAVKTRAETLAGRRKRQRGEETQVGLVDQSTL